MNNSKINGLIYSSQIDWVHIALISLDSHVIEMDLCAAVGATCETAKRQIQHYSYYSLWPTVNKLYANCIIIKYMYMYVCNEHEKTNKCT